ncbi:MAG TPA: acyl-CoA dehydrogenase family protein [Bacillota bacterium]
MEFRLDSRQQEWAQRARAFAREVIAPRADEIDTTGEYPWDIVQGMADEGFLGMNIPPAYGGSGESLTGICAVILEIGQVCASSAAILCAYLLGSYPILLAGSEAQKRKVLPEVAAGRRGPAFSLTERTAGSDAGSLRTTAVLEGDSWVLDGDKCFVGNGGAAHFYTVFARTGDRISAFLVEKGTPGFTIGPFERKMGIRGTMTAELHFRRCRIPRENLVGELGRGMRLALATLDLGRVTTAAQALAIAIGAYKHALRWAWERVQFGAPILENQAIQFMLADMITEIKAAELLIYKAAALHDAGAGRITREAAVAKVYATEVANRVVDRAVQIHGGYGYCKPNPVERFYRDQRVTQIYEGTSEIQRLVIARHLIEA